MEPVRDTQAMIAGMAPVLDPADYCFVVVPEGYRSRRIAEVAKKRADYRGTALRLSPALLSRAQAQRRERLAAGAGRLFL